MSFKLENMITITMCVQKSMLEMTEQLLFQVSWSTQYNPKSVILFRNRMYNFHFSGLLIL